MRIYGKLSAVWSVFLVLVLGLAMVLPGAAAAQQMQERKVYVFGNSLVHHLTDSDDTTVPHWLNRIAQAGGNRLVLDGSWGFLRNFVSDLPARPGWSFREVRSVMGGGSSFRSAGFDTVIITPANFIQYNAPDQPYDGENPDHTSPLEATGKLIGWIEAQSPDAQILIYEGWALMVGEVRRFPPDAGELRNYHLHNLGSYHQWFQSYVRSLQAQFPDRDIGLIPVASVLARLYTETDLVPLGASDLYEDDAPHGTATKYFLASLVSYAAIYGEAPPAGMNLPDSIHPAVRQNYTQIAEFIWNATRGDAQLRIHAGAQSVPAVPDTPAPARVVGAGPADQGVVAPGLPVDAVPVGDPALAMGLNGIADYSVQYPFLDVMKTARPWIGHLPGQWGGFEIDRLIEEGYLDEHGWPMRIPREVGRLESLILTDIPPEATSFAGRYVLTYEGEGRLEVSGRAKNMRYGPKEIRFDFTPGEGFVSIKLKHTDPGGLGNHIRNIRVVREDHLDLVRLGEVFNPAWLTHVQDLRVLRMLDWGLTNLTFQQDMADRPRPDDFSYAWRGVPVEVMVDLVNQVGADPWFTIPHMANDDYVRRYAELVLERLDPRLNVYVEYSNELWNFIFPQTHWAAEQAKSRWGENATDDAWMQFAGMRAAQVMQIWSEVFDGQAPGRLVRVVSIHTAWPGLEEALLQAPLWQAEAAGNRPPAEFFDAYAVTGYFGHEMGTDEFAPQILDWLDAGEDVAVREVAGALREGSLKDLLGNLLPYHAAVAAQHDMQMIMYEGGTHVVGLDGWTESQRLTDFFTAFNYSPEMAALYSDLLEGWHAAGGTLFNAFVDVGWPSRWGSWGHLRHLDDMNPRWQVLMDYNARHQVDWESRAPGSFSNGVIRRTVEGGGRVEAEHPRDILLGGPGDDVLVAMGCCVRIHGGGGQNTAVLQGVPDEYELLWRGDVLLARGPEGGEIRLANVQRLEFALAPGVVVEPVPPAQTK